VGENIGGGSLDTVINGGAATEAARRIEAFVSCWEIR
jgi:hypothetical protein